MTNPEMLVEIEVEAYSTGQSAEEREVKMAKRQFGLKLLPLLILGFFFLDKLASAQSIWIDRSADRAIWLEIQKPDFTDEYLGGGFFSEPLQTTFTTAALFLSARWRVSGPLVLRAELPFINVGIKDQYYIDPLGDTIQVEGGSENQFGNPFIGLEVGAPGSPLTGEFGVRFPIVDDQHLFSSGFGVFGDYDRFEAFFPDIMTFTAIANYQYRGPTGLLLRLRSGPAFMVVTEGGGDPELFADYSAQAGYQGSRVTVLAGLTGRALVTESDLSFGERTIHQLGLSASYATGRFIPGILFRVPMDDDLSEILDFVFGINVGYRLP